MDKTFHLLNLISLLSITQELNDLLKDTKAYKQKIKFHSNALEKELDKYLDKELTRIWGVDETIIINILKNQGELIKTMSELAHKSKPDDFIFINKLVNDYLNNPEKFKDMVSIELEKVD